MAISGTDVIAVVTTMESQIEAQQLAREMVECKLAACAQISEIESFYSWQGAVQNEKEFRILFKTTDVLYETIEQAILDRHPYELPAIHAYAIEKIHEPYGVWIKKNVS